MSRFGYSDLWPAFDGSSGQSSTYTSNWKLTTDFASQSISITTQTTASSRFTIRGSNDNGITDAIVNTSVITTITQQGTYTVDPGIRWLRIERASLESLSTVNMNLWAS